MSHPRATALTEPTATDVVGADRERATMCAAFQRVVAARAGEIALRTAGGGSSYTWAQYAERAALIAGGLAARGVRRGEAVALLLTNRPEFHFVDTAAQHVGAVPFSCHNTSSPEQIGRLLKASGARVAVTERLLAPAIRPFLDEPESPLNLLILVDGPRTSDDGDGNDAPRVLGLDDIAAPGIDLAVAAAAVSGDDLLTLVYTDGTAGKPKAVEITHGSMVAMAQATAPLIGVRPGDRLVSFLPAAHLADRWASHYLHLWCGTEVTCLADHRRIESALVEVRPTLFAGGPQVWLRLMAGIERLTDPAMVAAVEQSIEIGREFLRATAAGRVPDDLKALRNAADRMVLAPLRAKLGLDQVRVAVTTAPTPPEVVEFVNAIGVPLVEEPLIAESIDAR